MIKKIVGICMCIMLVLGSVNPIYASEGDDIDILELSKEEIREYFDVDKMAEEYEVDAEILLDKIYSDLHSNTGYFSPFSNIELGVTDEKSKSENTILSRSIPYTLYNQDATMYLETGNPCASGKYPYVGCCAVHKKSSSDPSPIFEFGTHIQLISGSVNISGENYIDFTVEDTGDSNYTRSWYWIDIYGGANNTENYTMAMNFGVQSVSYVWD